MATSPSQVIPAGSELALGMEPLAKPSALPARRRNANSVEGLRAQVAGTRVELDKTLDVLRCRLDPRAVWSRTTAAAKGRARALGAATRVTAATLAHRCDRAVADLRTRSKEDPVPAALAGISCLAMLIAWSARLRRARSKAKTPAPAPELWTAVPLPAATPHARRRTGIFMYAMWATIGCLASVGMKTALSRAPSAETRGAHAWGSLEPTRGAERPSISVRGWGPVRYEKS